MMKVSIITATYNSAATIASAIDSINEQTYQNVEYIVVDGASTDDTVEIIKTTCPRISKIVCEKDKGIYDALNKGLAAATGDIVGFLHSDDFFAYPDAIADVVKTIKSNDSDAVYADLEYVDKDQPTKVVRLWKSGDFSLKAMSNGWMPPHPTFYLKRTIYHELGGFDLSYKIAGDYESILRYLWSGKSSIAYLPKVLMKMRVGGASNRSLGNIILKSKEDVRALRRHNVPVLRALIWKNLSKIPQFIFK